jgi:biotin-dependent carboxylase-like uncharacterized protein
VRALTIVDAGPLTTMQDLGRFGSAHLGVPRAGALDAPAAALANRLVGNPTEAAVLETTMGGVAFSVDAAMTLAVTGAQCSVMVDGRAAPWGEAVSVSKGATVAIGPAETGVRSYVGLSGGIAVEPVLGSRSTDTLAYVGPPAVRVGDVLPVGPATDVPGEAAAIPRRPADVVLRYDEGPRADWFTSSPDGLYEVGGESNRVGLRLVGQPLVRKQDGELRSEGIVLGAIQVPANGQPLVFLNDHPTTGGYPFVGVVLAEDLHLCAQLRPGTAVTLRRR